MPACGARVQARRTACKQAETAVVSSAHAVPECDQRFVVKTEGGRKSSPVLLSLYFFGAF